MTIVENKNSYEKWWFYTFETTIHYINNGGFSYWQDSSILYNDYSILNYNNDSSTYISKDNTDSVDQYCNRVSILTNNLINDPYKISISVYKIHLDFTYLNPFIF